MWQGGLKIITKNKKWRGIPTREDRINEEEPVITVNRFGQYTLSLPRITDDKRWAGYPGLTGISRKLAKMIPECKFYIEPFAGMAKVWQAAKTFKSFNPKRVVLNDRSLFICQTLTALFKDIAGLEITSEDFAVCMEKNDSVDTFFLIDPPWNMSYYKQDFSHFDRRGVKNYDIEVINICKNLKGKFMITSRKENKVFLSSGFKNLLVQSEYVVSGRYPKVLVTTNIEGLNIPSEDQKHG